MGKDMKCKTKALKEIKLIIFISCIIQSNQSQGKFPNTKTGNIRKFLS